MPRDDGLAFCVLSQEYGDVRDGTHEILSEELGSGYRHQLIINGDPSKEAKMLELERDKSRFELTIAVGEYRPPRWPASARSTKLPPEKQPTSPSFEKRSTRSI